MPKQYIFNPLSEKGEDKFKIYTAMKVIIGTSFKREGHFDKDGKEIILKADEVVEDLTPLELKKYSGLYRTGSLTAQEIEAKLKSESEAKELKEADELKAKLEGKTAEVKTEEVKTEDPKIDTKADSKTENVKTDPKTEDKKASGKNK